MSVRRTAARGAQYQDRYGVMKGVLFWGFLLAASFIFGLLVVSPLINFAGARNEHLSSAPSTVTQQSPPPSSSPVVSAPATGRQETARRRNRSDEPTISVTEDRSERDLQRSETPDQTPATKSSNGEGSIVTNTPSGDTSETPSASSDESTGRATDVTGQERATSDESAKRAKPEAHRTRKHRSSAESATTDTGPARRTRKSDKSENSKPAAAPKPEIQKGESIDQ